MAGAGRDLWRAGGGNRPDRAAGGGRIKRFRPCAAGSAFPYIVLGESAAEPLETQAGGGYDTTLDIHTYSRALGMKEAKAVMAAISDCLHGQDFAVTGQRLVFCRLISQSLRQDGETRHGVQRFRIITEPV